MKSLILFEPFTFTSAALNAQLFTIKGKTQEVAYSQGGVELMPEAYLPKVLPHCKIYVIDLSNGSGQIIDSLASDSEGNFLLSLPEGIYNFAILATDGQLKKIHLPNQIDTIQIAINEDINAGWSHSDYWALDRLGPLIVDKNDADLITLTHYDISVCMMCP